MLASSQRRSALALHSNEFDCEPLVGDAPVRLGALSGHDIDLRSAARSLKKLPQAFRASGVVALAEEVTE